MGSLRQLAEICRDHHEFMRRPAVVTMNKTHKYLVVNTGDVITYDIVDGQFKLKSVWGDMSRLDAANLVEEFLGNAVPWVRERP